VISFLDKEAIISYTGGGKDDLSGGKGADFFDCGKGADETLDFNPQLDSKLSNCEDY
jgi:hypothetical protein